MFFSHQSHVTLSCTRRSLINAGPFIRSFTVSMLYCAEIQVQHAAAHTLFLQCAARRLHLRKLPRHPKQLSRGGVVG